MHRKTITLFTSIVALFILTSPLVAQRKPKPMPMADEQMASRPAVEKAGKLKEFREAVRAGEIRRVKSILIDNGAPANIKFSLVFPTTISSDPTPAETPNGPCDSGWVLRAYWKPNTNPPNMTSNGYWYFIGCVPNTTTVVVA